MPPEKKPNPATKTASADPNRLVRGEAGTYQTPDGRFTARRSGDAWFLIDAKATDELGQPLVHGPMATLQAVRGSIPDARRAGKPAGGRGRRRR